MQVGFVGNGLVRGVTQGHSFLGLSFKKNLSSSDFQLLVYRVEFQNFFSILR